MNSKLQKRFKYTFSNKIHRGKWAVLYGAHAHITHHILSDVYETLYPYTADPTNQGGTHMATKEEIMKYNKKVRTYADALLNIKKSHQGPLLSQ